MRGVLCLVLFASLACTAFAADDPEHAVRDAQHAIDTKNANLFEQRVDAERILNAATDMLMAEADKPNGNLPPMLTLMLSSVKDGQARAMLQTLIMREAHAFLRYAILSGHFAGKPDHSVRPGGMLAPLFGDVSMGRKELRVTGPAAPDERESVLVPAELKDYGNNNIYPLLLRLRRQPDWRIAEIVNLPDVWNQVLAEADAQR